MEKEVEAVADLGFVTWGGTENIKGAPKISKGR